VGAVPLTLTAEEEGNVSIAAGCANYASARSPIAVPHVDSAGSKSLLQLAIELVHEHFGQEERTSLQFNAAE